MPRRQNVQTLKQLCLCNVAANMKEVWAKDYTDNYLTQYDFLYIIGPFNDLASSLVEDLLRLLGETHRLSRAYLHLLLVPHLVELSLRSCSGLVSNAIGQIIHARCQGLTSLDLHGCNRIQSSLLVDLIECLPRLRKLILSGTQCNLQVLSAIGCTCKELRELDVSMCKAVTSLALLHLVYDQSRAAFNPLQLGKLLTEGIQLCPDSTEQQVTIVAFLLLALPRLEYISPTFLAEALTLIHKRLFGKGQQFLHSQGFPCLEKALGLRVTPGDGPSQIALSLRQLEVGPGQDLSIVTSICREVVEARVSLDDEIRDLQCFNSWKQLTHLTVDCTGDAKRTLSEMIPIFSCLGCRLHFLSLQNFHYHLETSVSRILELCPSLHVFQALLHPPPQNCSSALVNEDSDGEDDDQQPDESFLLPVNWHFPHLKDFSLRLFDSTLMPRSFQLSLGTAMISTLQGSPRLEKLSLINIHLNLDRLFQKVLEQPASLVQLTELCLSQSRVSPVTVQLLMTTDNQLTSLDIRHCHNIHRRHYDRFVTDAKRSKFDLQIVWE
ncbi:uncharacterized protein si:ch211-214j8.12 isoform X1 [Hemiscyllium ocellatum]|uniref:uncharacterized protein si:ch211-214j8.12 isoform X1 n=1 Tax=Hemiscyllium ocellatum TaxID=170820 RepID=UPI002965D97A|nr:uncharacterized protein si:ch211-214j8.12 isoform X1 [Hemiscyllium ocellatum]XP_060688835.1 uncharacterized protein si:ch211-214j8.12 isoform X1 [Hemiscyllium ocellatum]XP_060688920.1 uncharacterized protein si:ch211-214j8.12 isoform X1 [Hemiscyllium ocellatum]XP_060688999.1 uncharacterized protein si:ch211-214j8.12 isoform X1 [Hemiscyllium ocellatum]XP_060689082.1 uncharacterized protein si:ch211-214j8.12 isoform X1 [Hemiscyllium ocellatum]XP_060689164.1 uncharacterized protein si:ch211-21